MYLFGLKPVTFYCFGGGGSPPPVQEPTPPPQLAKPPAAQDVRKAASANASATGGAVDPGSVTLLGDPTALDDKLGKKTLLGK